MDPTVNEFNEFLKNYGVWIAVSVAAVIFLTVLIFFVISLKKKNNKISPELSINEYKEIYQCLGGKDNIKNHFIKGSRITLELIDNSCINELEIKNYGVDSIIKMSNKVILIVSQNPKKFYDKYFI